MRTTVLVAIAVTLLPPSSAKAVETTATDSYASLPGIGCDGSSLTPPACVPNDQHDFDIMYDKIVPGAPQPPARPLVIYVHGGGWTTGGKHVFDSVNKIGQTFYSQGYAFASINYRLLYTAKDAEGRPISIAANPVPTIPYDLAEAIRYLRDNAATYNIKPNQIVLVGHSAGAHLVALMMANPAYLNSVGVGRASIRSLVLLDAHVYDLNLEFSETSRYAEEMNFLNLRPVFNVLVGSQLHEQQDASPGYHVRNLASSAYFPPTFALYGKDCAGDPGCNHPDPEASSAQARDFIGDLRARLPADYRLTLIKGKEMNIQHGDFLKLLDMQQDGSTEYCNPVFKFLRENP